MILTPAYLLVSITTKYIKRKVLWICVMAHIIDDEKFQSVTRLCQVLARNNSTIFLHSSQSPPNSEINDFLFLFQCPLSNTLYFQDCQLNNQTSVSCFMILYKYAFNRRFRLRFEFCYTALTSDLSLFPPPLLTYFQ